ncbi:hypothetical protein C8C77_10415 [Halanaerobium saccharolyticum]|uniref:Uncharacterized protein n=1 Tax=Halanaerobium saccharolyticum TaxID=43595 RepID=A0A4R7Z7Q1_9FIRM|nr:hypothetical protein [Halanaerobium saccharolyticum]RAK10616.1 hypothetical protein C7958_104137 [Halanaerobium saccharolyticum]TDW06627.1 hypothetical protein C8C77_10415 [Halanaerobium saccharolyticum]TDX62262.1 hypothetical protein C7956_10415 [Halanaerobium saccharolyticum]
MKKLLVVVLAMLLVAGFSAVGLAASPAVAEVIVNVTVEPYYDVWFDTPDIYKGLFGNENTPIGQPGIYISDGNTTRNSVLDIWDSAIAYAENNGISSGEVYEAYFEEGQGASPQVELFKVDANTTVDVTLSADFTGWMDAPTIFRVSSDQDTDQINGYGDWATDLALVGNTGLTANNPLYQPLLDEHNTAAAGLDDTFTLDFADELLCYGPIDFHLNGALWMPKVSQVAAGDYEAIVIVTVAASPSI